MQTTVIERAAFVAEYQARAALRAGRAGDDRGFDAHRAKMLAVISGSKYPASVAKGLVQLVGRGRAMVLKLSKAIINEALRPTTPVLACHYLAPSRPLVRFDRFQLEHVEVVGDRVGLWDMLELRAMIVSDDAQGLGESLDLLVGAMIDVEFEGNEVVAVREV